MKAFLTLMGMYEYDSTIFDEMTFPEKWSTNDISNFIFKLLFDTAELEILYPDPETMTNAIKYWSAAYAPNWNKLYNTTILDYNPIWNKDGTITESETIGRKHSDNESGEETTNNSQTATSTTTTNEKDYVFGYNSEVKAQSGEVDTTENNTGTVTGTGTTNRSADRSGTDDEDREYTRRETGNIGITTTQKMIREEREVDKFNLMDYIINDFKNRFCVLIY